LRLKATVTPENLSDSPLLPDLFEDLEADYVLVDKGYDSKRKSGVDCCFGSNYSTELMNSLTDASYIRKVISFCIKYNVIRTHDGMSHFNAFKLKYLLDNRKRLPLLSSN
jgi:hypothetical protein